MAQETPMSLYMLNMWACGLTLAEAQASLAFQGCDDETQSLLVTMWKRLDWAFIYICENSGISDNACKVTRKRIRDKKA